MKKKKIEIKGGLFFSRTFIIERPYEEPYIQRKRIGKNEEEILICFGLPMWEIEKDSKKRKELSDCFNRLSSLRERLEAERGSLSNYEFAKHLKQSRPDLFEYYINHTPHLKAKLECLIDHHNKCAEMFSVYVLDLFRGKGYATKLIKRFLEIVDEYGYPIFGRLSAFEGDTPDLQLRTISKKRISDKEYYRRQKQLLDFYERFGFKKISTYIHIYNCYNYEEREQKTVEREQYIIKRKGLKYDSESGCR
jgi:GNAT superfamily N-acetyltransferase